MTRTDDFLAEMSHAMGGSLAEQQAARDEILAHLREAVREHEIDGLPHDDAEARALADLGDPAIVGRAMRRSRGTAPLRRPLPQPAGALVLQRRSSVRLPGTRVSVALLALAAMLAAVPLIYLWPS
jgi:hypothetical protein